MKGIWRLLLLVALASTARADSTVQAAQQSLKRLGYYNGTVDGEPGSQTSAAIRRYQVAMNLKVDGQLNEQTLKSLSIPASPKTAQAAAARPQSAPPAKPQPTPKPALQPFFFGKPKAPTAQPVPEYVAIADLFKGGPYITAPTDIQIATVRMAQRNLRTLGYYHGPINGTPSGPLVVALKAWQQSAGFRQTGRFDESTLKGLDLMPN